MNDNIIKMKLKNAEGKRLLETNRLEYSKAIICELDAVPSELTNILNELQMTETEFFSYLSGDVPGNITFYDQALTLTKSKKETKR